MFTMNKGPLYDQTAVQPMRDELTAVGIKELLTPAEVEAAIEQKNDKTIMVVINSVCGCAAGSARPGVASALQNKIIPDENYTVFAGKEREAVEKVRSYIKDFPASSPSIAFFKNGNLIHFIPRFGIEGYTANEVAKTLTGVFDELCSGEGPSISPEEFAKLSHAQICSSQIPLNKG